EIRREVVAVARDVPAAAPVADADRHRVPERDVRERRRRACGREHAGQERHRCERRRAPPLPGGGHATDLVSPTAGAGQRKSAAALRRKAARPAFLWSRREVCRTRLPRGGPHMTLAKAGTGQTALITGASGGIGIDLAECFAREGYDVVLTA